MSVSFSGLTPTNLPTNSRSVLDANYIKSIALPGSAATVVTASMDLGDAISGIPYASTETFNVQIVAPALNSPKLADNGTVTYTLMDSADDSSFTAITGLSTLVQTGAASAGAAAATRVVKLPPITRRYIRLSVTTATSPGDLSTASATLQLAF
jgi:hypothetical protein